MKWSARPGTTKIYGTRLSQTLPCQWCPDSGRTTPTDTTHSGDAHWATSIGLSAVLWISIPAAASSRPAKKKEERCTFFMTQMGSRYPILVVCGFGLLSCPHDWAQNSAKSKNQATVTLHSVVDETGGRSGILERHKLWFQFRLVHCIDPSSIEHRSACQ